MELSDSDEAMSVDGGDKERGLGSWMSKGQGAAAAPVAAKPPLSSNVPWVEKYRPMKVDEVSHQEEVVRAMKKCTERKNLPHLLFYGPPGTGKTSLILAVAKELYGVTNYRDRVLELNASDERGIDVIRNKVKKFAQFAVSGNQKHEGTGEPLPPFKIIILDEADSLTKDAQAALRRIIENYTKVTRFCIICNYISRIIDPITSRCSKFRFQPLSHEAHLARLSYITSLENIQITPDALTAAMQQAEGDLRRSINLIQSASGLFVGQAITADQVTEIAGAVPASVATQTIQLAFTSNSTRELANHAKEIIAEGYSVSQYAQQLLDSIVKEPRMTDLQKAKAAKVMSTADHRLCDGSDEAIQLTWIASELRKICHGA